MQLTIVGALNRLDGGESLELVFAHDGAHFIAFVAANLIEAVRTVAEYFTGRGVTDANKLAIFCTSLRTAYDTVCARAAKARIEYPARVWPTPQELDAGSELLAAAIGPRTSPIIERWQQIRTDEVGAATHRAEGTLS